MTARTAVPVVAALTLLAAVPSSAFARQSLHGKWKATVMADDGGKEHADTLEFTPGDQFTSEKMAADGYKPAAYTGRQSFVGSAEQFQTTLANKAGDTAVWQGQVLGGQVSGTLTITRKDQAPVGYSFKATRQ